MSGLGQGYWRRRTSAYKSGYDRGRQARMRSAYKRRLQRQRTSRLRKKIKVVPEEMKYVEGFLNSEVIIEQANDDTWADTELDPDYDNANPTTYGQMPMPALGNAFFNRDGRKIFVDNIKIRGIVNFNTLVNQSTGFDNRFVRLVLVEDNQTNGVQMNGEDALGPGFDQAGNASVLADSGIQAFSAPNGWGRFKILKSRYIFPWEQTVTTVATDISTGNAITGARNGCQVPFKMTIKPKCYVNFSGNSGVVGSVVDKSWHLLAMASSTTGVTVLSYIARTCFKG